MQQPERQPIPGVKNLVAVASGKGGVARPRSREPRAGVGEARPQS